METSGRTAGVLWVGPPNSNPLWSAIVARRDPGSPQRLPVYDGDLSVRFADEPSDMNRPDGPWHPPRVLFLQHAFDPVVWWSPDLLLGRPDWLEEPRGEDVLPAMRWYPFVTVWQVAADLTVANTLAAGHDHRYDRLIPAGWAAVAGPDSWTTRDSLRLREVLAG